MNYEPKGMVFWSQGKSIMHVSDEEHRESLRGWLLYRHPDGQWVTLRKVTDADLEAIYNAGVENGRVIVKLPDMDCFSADNPRAFNFLVRQSARAIAGELLQCRQELRVINSRIETLIGVTCKRCERGDELFVEPETRFYTHSLGGNYCDAHKLHSLLDTEASRKARKRKSE